MGAVKQLGPADKDKGAARERKPNAARGKKRVEDHRSKEELLDQLSECGGCGVCCCVVCWVTQMTQSDALCTLCQVDVGWALPRSSPS